MIIEHLILSIKNNDIVVPEFQREFVWGNDRVKSLINSLMNAYPIGGILLWKTNSPPSLKGEINNNIDTKRTYQVLLDGQQRSTALYLMIEGEIPPYYTVNDITKDPRSLAYNLYSAELQYWKSSMKNDKCWVYVSDCMQNKIEPVDIAFQLSEKFSNLEKLKDFQFNFDIEKDRQAFSLVKKLFQQVEIDIKFASQQIWKIYFPTNVVNTSISELESLHDDDNNINQKRFYDFWKKTLGKLDDVIEKYKDSRNLVTLFVNNHRKLIGIKNLNLFTQEIPQGSSFSDAIDIFDRINSRGVQLSQADLALTHITAIWPEARKEMKSVLENLKSKGFELSLTITTRLLIAKTTGRGSFENISQARFDPIRSLNRDMLKGSWDETTKILYYLVDILKSENFTNSHLIKSKSVLIPIFYFLCLHNGKFNNDIDRKNAVYWLHMALIWGRYAGSADQKLEEDLNIIKEDKPWNKLISKIIEQRGRIEIQNSDLEGQGSDSRFFNTYCIMLSQNEARDWFNGIPINQNAYSFSLHKHHIFPVALLKRNGFSTDNKIQNDLINEISNLAIITSNTNLQISDREPSKYLPEILQRYPNSIQNHYIPDNQELWKVENFREFLINRRTLISKAMNEFLDNYKENEANFYDDQNITQLVQLDESETLEYKETWEYDIRQSMARNEPSGSSQMQLNCIKTVAAFLNSNGGNLFIGINDDKVVEGIERDLELVSNNSLDLLQNKISQKFIDALGTEKKPYYSVEQHEIDGQIIFRIKVEKCISSKTWVKFEKEQNFYIRDANSTRRLTPEEADNYWLERENT